MALQSLGPDRRHASATGKPIALGDPPSDVGPGLLERRLHAWYARWLRPLLPRDIDQQRLKLVYFGWGYWPLLKLATLPLWGRVTLLVQFLRVDWHVLHAHRPNEIASVCQALAARRAQPGEVMVEAGCWNGGSSAKFSLICKLGGYRLHIYDSFEGVEPLGSEEKRQGHDFSGAYAAPEAVLHDTLRRFGDPSVCTVHTGWFRTTLARHPVPDPVRLAFMDCDSAKGTEEVLSGVAPRLTADGVVFSQDYHIASVRQVLCDPRTWRRLGMREPTITRLGGHLASLRTASA